MDISHIDMIACTHIDINKVVWIYLISGDRPKADGLSNYPLCY